MTDKSQCNGDTLPMGIAPPTEQEIEHARRTMRHALVSAPAARGTLFGISVEDLTDVDRALAFDWLWQQMQNAARRG